jgi:hypothetical protein
LLPHRAQLPAKLPLKLPLFALSVLTYLCTVLARKGASPSLSLLQSVRLGEPARVSIREEEAA